MSPSQLRRQLLAQLAKLDYWLGQPCCQAKRESLLRQRWVRQHQFAANEARRTERRHSTPATS